MNDITSRWEAPEREGNSQQDKETAYKMRELCKWCSTNTKNKESKNSTATQ